MKWSLKTTHPRHTKELKRNQTFTSLLKPGIAIYIYIYIYIYILQIQHKTLYNIQIQTEYIASKKIIQNFAQMKYKWPVTAIKPLKSKLFSVTSNPSTLVYFMSSMIQFHSWLNLLTAARLNQT